MHKQHPVAAGSRRIYRRQKMGFVLIHIAYFFLKPQDVVVFILNTASPWIIPKRSTAPQHTRFILPPIHPTKFFACLAGRYFSFGKLYLESYISRLNEILRHDLTLSVGEPDNAAAKQGQELRSV